MGSKKKVLLNKNNYHCLENYSSKNIFNFCMTFFCNDVTYVFDEPVKNYSRKAGLRGAESKYFD